MLANIKRLLLGNGLAQGLQFASILLLSRIYKPSDFGLLGQVQSIATVAAIIATLQLHLAIPLCTTAQEARTMAIRVQSISCTLFLLCLPFALYFDGILVYSLLLTLFLGLTNTYNGCLVARASFGSLSSFYVSRAALIIGLQALFALLEVNDGLVWGALSGEGLASLYLRFLLLGPPRSPILEIRAAIDLAMKWKAFALFGTLQELVSVSAFYAPLALFASKFGESVGGQYAMANRLVWAPVILLSSSVAQVLYHHFGQKPPSTLSWLLNFRRAKWLVAAALTAAGLSFYLEDLFFLALGRQWSLASKLIPLQLLWGCCFLLSTPFRVVSRVLHLQKYQLSIDALVLALIVSAFVVVEASPLHTMWYLVLIAVLQNTMLAVFVVVAASGSNGAKAPQL